MDSTGKHGRVFGGTTGIGFGIAENFPKHGANMSVASRKQENIDAATAALGTAGRNIVGVAADVRDFDEVGRAFNTAASQLGPIDIVVSGAAGDFLAPAKDLSANGFRTVVVDIDLNGTFNVFRGCLRPDPQARRVPSSPSPRRRRSTPCPSRPTPAPPRPASTT